MAMSGNAGCHLVDCFHFCFEMVKIKRWRAAAECMNWVCVSVCVCESVWVSVYVWEWEEVTCDWGKQRSDKFRNWLLWLQLQSYGAWVKPS